MNEVYKFFIIITSTICCTILAVIFQRWWIILVSVIELLILRMDFKVSIGISEAEEGEEDE